MYKHIFQGDILVLRSVASLWERLGNALPLGAESSRHNPQLGPGAGEEAV